MAEIINAIANLIKIIAGIFKKTPEEPPIVKYAPEHESDDEDDRGDLTKFEDKILERRTAKRNRNNGKIPK